MVIYHVKSKKIALNKSNWYVKGIIMKIILTMVIMVVIIPW